MRVALVGPTYPYKGGGAQHTTELAHRLAAAGHDVVVESWNAQYPAFLYPGRQTIDAPESAPFPHVTRELSWRRPDGWVRVGRRLARTADLVVLTVLSPVQVPAYLGILYPRGAPPPAHPPSSRFTLSGRARRTSFVALCHNVLPHERKPYDAPLMRALLRKVDGVLTHSAAQADLARSLAATPVRQVTMPPHLPGSRGPSGVRELRNRLLFFGLVRPYKGLDVLLRALARVPGTRLTVAGEFWGGVAETRALIAELGLAERVDLRPGYVAADAVAGLFASADALVLPYRSATASQNVWLAHEHGLPVITTRVLSGHVTDGVDGLVCEPGDVDDLAKAIERFYREGEPERLGAAVRPVDPEPYWAAYLEALLSFG